MLNIQSILEYIFNGVYNGDQRYVLIDDEHILDSKTGVKLHMYDNWFKLTHNDEPIIMRDDFTQEEQEVIMKIKQLITTPEKAEERKKQYPIELKERRQKLSDLFENPSPVTMRNPIVEEGTDTYTG